MKQVYRLMVFLLATTNSLAQQPDGFGWSAKPLQWTQTPLSNSGIFQSGSYQVAYFSAAASKNTENSKTNHDNEKPLVLALGYSPKSSSIEIHVLSQSTASWKNLSSQQWGDIPPSVEKAQFQTIDTPSGSWILYFYKLPGQQPTARLLEIGKLIWYNVTVNSKADVPIFDDNLISSGDPISGNFYVVRNDTLFVSSNLNVMNTKNSIWNSFIRQMGPAPNKIAFVNSSLFIIGQTPNTQSSLAKLNLAGISSSQFEVLVPAVDFGVNLTVAVVGKSQLLVTYGTDPKTFQKRFSFFRPSDGRIWSINAGSDTNIVSIAQRSSTNVGMWDNQLVVINTDFLSTLNIADYFPIGEFDGVRPTVTTTLPPIFSSPTPNSPPPSAPPPSGPPPSSPPPGNSMDIWSQYWLENPGATIGIVIAVVLVVVCCGFGSGGFLACRRNRKLEKENAKARDQRRQSKQKLSGSRRDLASPRESIGKLNSIDAISRYQLGDKSGRQYKSSALYSSPPASPLRDRAPSFNF